MNACDELKPILVELVFGELEPEPEMRAHEHLAACATCRAEEARLVALREAVRGSAAGPAPALRERVRAALPRSPARAAVPWFRRPVPGYAVPAAALLSALLVLGVSGRPAPARPPAPATTRAGQLTPAARHLSFAAARPFDTDVRTVRLDRSAWDSTSARRAPRGDST
jgi:anti-sigma factor RsiW